MTLINKLKFLFSARRFKFSPLIDSFLYAVMERGEITEIDWFAHKIQLTLDGNTYVITVYLTISLDLTTCVDAYDGTYIWDDMRPSRLAHLRFREWLERRYPEVFKTSFERCEDKLLAILSKEKV